MQSNLKHLTWQTSMVASGDYSQHVDFMGDFSMSFNTMILRLKEATENEQRYIAELKKSQAIIEESERKYRLIAENTDDVIWLLDTEMNIRYISPSIEKLLGYSPEEFEGKPAIETPLPFLQAIFQE
ncbi:MAG TPA: PAS domain S-box protein, partial [Negativicutes bacterium]